MGGEQLCRYAGGLGIVELACHMRVQSVRMRIVKRIERDLRSNFRNDDLANIVPSLGSWFQRCWVVLNGGFVRSNARMLEARQMRRAVTSSGIKADGRMGRSLTS